jgi:hypothetical protein
MAATVHDLHEYLRQPADTPESLAPYLAAAKAKAQAAGVPDYQANAQYDLFLLALAATYYTERGMAPSGQGQEQAAQRMVNSFVLELRHPPKDEGTGGDEVQITAIKDISGRVAMKKGETRNVQRGIAEALVANGLAAEAGQAPTPGGGCGGLADGLADGAEPRESQP